MKSLIRSIIAVVVCLSPLLAHAFGNEDVIQLLSANFGEDVVLNAISTANPAAFDTSASGLIKLRNAGASTTVIQKVITRQGENRPTGKVSVMGGGECQLESVGMENMVPVRADGKIIGLKPQTPETSVDVNVGSAILNVFTLGIAKAKGSSSLVLPGNRASVRISDKTPEFLDELFPPGFPPENMTFLVHMTVKENSRSVQTASVETNISGYQGRTMSFGDNVRVPLTMEKIAECTWRGRHFSHYRVKLATPLEQGEYGYLLGNMLYDFGVD